MSRNLARVGTVAIFLLAACSGEVALPAAQATVVQPNLITGNVVRLDGSGSNDPQGRQLFFEWSFISVADGSAATLVDANQMLPSFRADMPGDYVVQLVVSNGVVKSQPSKVTVHVTPCGFAAPTVTVATNTFSVTPRTAVHLSAVASDPDNQCLPANAKQTVTVEWEVNSRPPTSSAIVSDPSSATPIFTPDVAGDYQLRITALDSTGRSSPAAFVNVTADTCSLLAPTASFSSAVLSGTTGTLVNLSAIVGTNNCLSTGTFSYSWKLAERPAGSQAFLSNAVATTPSFTPDVAGAYLVELTVNDTSVGLSSMTTVQTVNVVRAACGFAAPQIVNARGTPALPSPGTMVTLSATAVDRDNDPAGCHLGQAISFNWTPISAPSGSHAQLSDASSAAPTFVADFAGTYAFTVVATDSDGLASSAAGVVVQTAACAPVLGAVSSLSTMIGTIASLVAPPVTDSCVTSPAYGYRWTLNSRPAASSAVLSATNSSTASFTPDVVGDYQAQLIVTDQGGFASAPLAITVHAGTCAHLRPTLSSLAATPASPNVGDTTTFSVAVDDLNGSTCNAVPITPFQYSWSLVSTPHGSAAALALATNAVPVLVPDLPGSYQLSVIVTDALGNSSDPAFLTMTTTNCGFFAPAAAIVQSSPMVTNSNTPVALSAVANSPDNNPAICPAPFGDTFKFSWSIVTSPGSSRLTSSSGSATSFSAATEGSYVVQVVATASNGVSSAPALVTINVSACGSSSPVIVATSNTPAFPAPTQDVSLAAVATDADTGCGFLVPGLTWSIHSLPQGSATILQNPGGAAHFVPDVQGTYVFRVVATDSTALSSAPAFVSVDALNADPDTSSVVASGRLTTTLVVADNVDPGTVTATVRNARGNPIAQLPVRIDSSGSGNTFRPPGNSGLTDVNGVFVATLVSTKAELKTFTATANPVFSAVPVAQRSSLEYVSGPAASIALTGLPGEVTAGNEVTVAVTAFDQFLNVAKGPNAYTGTVHFSHNDPHSAPFVAIVPADFTFSPVNNGTHQFADGVTFFTAGSRTLTVMDTANGTFTSSQTTTVDSAGATIIALATPASTTAGVAFSATVSAHDAFGNVAKGPNAYTGTVDFTSSDAHAVFDPASHIFVASDNGAFTASTTLKTAPSQTITASDSGHSFIDTKTVTVNSAAAASITLTTAASTTAGVAFSATVTAHDAFGNVAKGPNAYTGTVDFTSSDGQAVLIPTSHVFVAGDNGTFAGSATLKTAPSQTITATDSGNAFTNAKTVTVNPAAAASLTVVVATNPAATAVASDLTVLALDQFSNIATGYVGTVHFSSTDTLATLPGDSSLINGAKTFTNGVTFNTVGSQTVTATDSVASGITGTSAAVTVNAWFSTANGNVHSRRLAVDAATTNAYAATSTGVYRSTDHGASWSAATTQPTDVSVEEIAVAPGSNLYAATSTGGVFMSTDNGVSWTEANGSTTALADLNTLSIVADPHDATGSTVYVGTSTKVFVSTDGGATAWTMTGIKGFPTVDDPVTALAIDAAGNVFAGTVGGFVYKFDGTSWADLTSPSTGTVEVDSLAVNSGALFAGTADGTIFQFSSGTWNSGVATSANPIFQISFASASIGYAASAGGGVFKTTDGGGATDWTAVNTGITNLSVRGVAVDSTIGTTVFAGSNGSGFFQTLTAGE